MQDYEKKHLSMLRPYLPECIVLLKSNGAFPLEAPVEIALYGSGARRTVKGGTGSGEVNSQSFLAVEQGLRDAGFTVTTSAWMDAYDGIVRDAHARFIRGIKNRARARHTLAVMDGMGAVMPEPEYDIPLSGVVDTAVYVLSRISGEGNDRAFQRGDVLLTESEKRDILYLQRNCPRFLLVLNVGGPVDLEPVLEVENILILSQLGSETGGALADLILGKTFPSGKLATTWATAGSYPDIGEFGDMNDTRYWEGIYVGYRYFDSAKVRPLFPFGFGLGYTSFELAPADFRMEGADTVSVSVRVRNTGRYPGKETVQLYVSVPEGKLDQPYQRLATFQKTPVLEPGAETELRLFFALHDLASFDTEDAAWILEPGDYVLRLGADSRDTQIVGTVCLTGAATVRRVRNSLGSAGFSDWKPAERNSADLPEAVQRLLIDPDQIPFEETSYDRVRPVNEQMKCLSDEELAYMSVGMFDPKGGLLSMVGNAGRSVAGAAGETSGALRYQGVPSLVMADGPAGLRLAKDYVKDGNGVHSLGAAFPESMLELLPSPVRCLLQIMQRRPGKRTEILHQYCTAIPIGTALAQSWNEDFAYLCGDIIGEEMERFGVHLWLAPALNIHRDIRCGRNFEYFSEDPLVSGIFAAALTNGIQSHPGRGATVKHFAANNQETNRYNSNSRVSERALREIYLRGFEICIQRSQPRALMTSYNLINGIHTSERADLIGDILHCEFGFRGIVMTDWVVNGGTINRESLYPGVEAWETAAAGSNLFMPGSRKDWRNVLSALHSGKLSREQLEASVADMIRLAGELAE